MKKLAILCLSTIILLALTACGSSTKSYAYYEFYCEGDMTVTHGDTAVVLSAEETDTLLRIWGNPWEGGKAKGTFDYAFTWENTTIRYCSDTGVFQIGDNGANMVLSRDDRKRVESILDTYR